MILQQIIALFNQSVDPAGHTYPNSSTTQHLADVKYSFGVDVVAMTIGLEQLLNVLQVVPEMVSAWPAIGRMYHSNAYVAN